MADIVQATILLFRIGPSSIRSRIQLLDLVLNDHTIPKHNDDPTVRATERADSIMRDDDDMDDEFEDDDAEDLDDDDDFDDEGDDDLGDEDDLDDDDEDEDEDDDEEDEDDDD